MGGCPVPIPSRRRPLQKKVMAPELWRMLDDDVMRVVFLFLRTGDLFAVRAATSSDACACLLESDWEDRLLEQPRWARCWVASAGAASARAALLGSCEVRARLDDPRTATIEKAGGPDQPQIFLTFDNMRAMRREHRTVLARSRISTIKNAVKDCGYSSGRPRPPSSRPIRRAPPPVGRC